MKIGVRKEAAAGERRVAVMPDSVKRLAAKKIEVAVEPGAGVGSLVSDDDYRTAGAAVEASPESLLASADVFLQIRPPSPEGVRLLREGSTLISLLYPLVNLETVRALAARKVTAIALDMIPRTTVAQMMDVLSSQATAAGYHSVVMAAGALPRFFPMLMTAAGTIAPARALILGAGVAGLTAIGTARRLGAVVEAFDVRKAVKEQVESLGAKFVEVKSDEDAQTAGGYAKEVTEEYKKRQAEAIAAHVETADVIICTALIPGRRAPVLVTEAMVKTMKPGSVIVDMAAEQGGNCEGSEAGKTVVKHGVTIIGDTNLPSMLAVHASQMFSRNMEKLLFHLTKDGALRIDLGEEITRGAVITHEGAIVHAQVKEAAAGPAAEKGAA